MTKNVTKKIFLKNKVKYNYINKRKLPSFIEYIKLKKCKKILENELKGKERMEKIIDRLYDDAITLYGEESLKPREVVKAELLSSGTIEIKEGNENA